MAIFNSYVTVYQRVWSSCAEILTRRCFIESLRTDLDQICLVESLQILPGDLAQRLFTEILPRELLHRDVLQRSCIEISDRETLYRDLLQHSDIEISTEILLRDLRPRACTECLPRAPRWRCVQKSCIEIPGRETLYRDLSFEPLLCCLLSTFL